MNIQSAARELIKIGKLMYAKNFVAANDGNISIRLDRERILITPSGVSKGFMKSADMASVNFDGRKIQGKMGPSSESQMHLEIYKNKPEVNCICHAHPPFATALSASGKTIPENILPEAVISLGAVPLVPFAAPGTKELSEMMIPFLKDNAAFLLANHGAVTTGTSAMQAWYRMETLEHAAKIIILAELAGQPQLLSAEQIDVVKRTYSLSTDKNADLQTLIDKISLEVVEILSEKK